MTDDDTDTMAEISHANPYTGRTVGQLFSRGPTAVADGGEPTGTDTTDRSRTETMGDVQHTPPNGAADANGVFERGSEHTRHVDE